MFGIYLKDFCISTPHPGKILVLSLLDNETSDHSTSYGHVCSCICVYYFHDASSVTFFLYLNEKLQLYRGCER